MATIDLNHESRKRETTSKNLKRGSYSELGFTNTTILTFRKQKLSQVQNFPTELAKVLLYFFLIRVRFVFEIIYFIFLSKNNKYVGFFTKFFLFVKYFDALTFVTTYPISIGARKQSKGINGTFILFSEPPYAPNARPHTSISTKNQFSYHNHFYFGLCNMHLLNGFSKVMYHSVKKGEEKRLDLCYVINT